MYALRKYDKPKTIKVKKIVPDMAKLGPLYKGKAGKIKTLLEKMKVGEAKKITVNLDDEII
jgi:glycyl-tRNA synthetase (class II)